MKRGRTAQDAKTPRVQIAIAITHIIMGIASIVTGIAAAISVLRTGALSWGFVAFWAGLMAVELIIERVVLRPPPEPDQPPISPGYASVLLGLCLGLIGAINLEDTDGKVLPIAIIVLGFAFVASWVRDERRHRAFYGF